jgi:hypothetical protein
MEGGKSGVLAEPIRRGRLMHCKVRMDAGGGAVLRPVVGAGRVDSLPDI